MKFLQQIMRLFGTVKANLNNLQGTYGRHLKITRYLRKVLEMNLMILQETGEEQ